MSPEKRRGGPGASRAATAAPVLRRVVLVALALFTAWHILASFLWIAPAGPARGLVPDQALRGYMVPMFGQSWSVFAPNPISGDYRIDVRAALDTGDGDESITDWTRATTAEISYSQHNLFPPRSVPQITGALADLYNAHGRLSDESEQTVALNFFKDDWQDRLAETLEGDSRAAAYLEAERVLTAYATQVAYAVWGDDVTRVQFRVMRAPIVPFENRHDERAVRPDPVIRETGWRGTYEAPGQSREQFRDYFCGAPIGICP